jgi:hypothetical protein
MTDLRSETPRVRAEDAPEFNSPERKHLTAIWRRLAFLSRRIDAHTGSTSHDRAERAALTWLLNEIGAPLPPEQSWDEREDES